ncbi:hypothetical protein LTR15_010496 [Elasticomyces elasticus]|nr:hypothetical protein LTR15_010496 [Elasticomyces elasticus]
MLTSLAPKSPFLPPSLLYILLTQPLKSVTRFLHHFISLLRSKTRPGSPPIRIVCISDTHTLIPTHIPDGDLLIHAGDLTKSGTPAELQAQIDLLATLPRKHKVVIAGNHDTYLDPRSRRTLSAEDQGGKLNWKGINYLQHSSMTLKFGQRSLNLYGAPQIPACGGEDFAFQYPRGQDAWTETVPEGTDVLITHAPPKYHLDLPAALGCEYLLAESRRVKPKLHIFGHVHAGRSDTLGWLKGGKEVVRWDQGERSLDRLLSRPDGLVTALLDAWAWIEAVKVVGYGIAGVLWERVWRGGLSEMTVMLRPSHHFNYLPELDLPNNNYITIHQRKSPMPPTQPSTITVQGAATAATADPICTPCGTNTGLERIDATKLNTLLTSLTERLSRDAHGNFFVQGARTGKDTRHGQLGELFSLVTRLEGFKTTMDKYIELHSPKDVPEAEKSTSLNKSTRATMESVIDSRVEARFRDLQLRCERLEADELRRKQADAKAEEDKQNRAAAGGVPKTKDVLAKLTLKVDEVVRAQAAHAAAVKGQDETRDGQDASTRSDVSKLEDELKRATDDAALLEADVVRLQSSKVRIDTDVDTLWKDNSKIRKQIAELSEKTKHVRKIN